MPREDGPAEANDVLTRGTPSEVIPRIAREIALLDPGPVAALRRGPRAGAGAAAFWKLLAKHNLIDSKGWAALIQAIALLTPKGRHAEKRPAHDYSISMGKALYNAGVSELRLARLLGATADQRPRFAVRACRRLAATEFSRFDLVTLGHFILFGREVTDRRIARDYYRAEAAARRKSEDRETPTDA